MYPITDFDRNIVVKERTETVAAKITEFLKGTDRYAKTIVFCVDIDHAERMRQALVSCNREYGWAVADSHVTVIRTMESWLNFRFAYSHFAGPSVQLRIESQASGSTKQKELAQETVRNYLVPIPPLEEQQRIVKKVDQIMKLIGA